MPRKLGSQEQSSAVNETEEVTKPSKKKRIAMAELLARTFNIDIKHCQGCGGEMKIIAVIMETAAIRKILEHLDLPFRPPDIAPSRVGIQENFG